MRVLYTMNLGFDIQILPGVCVCVWVCVRVCQGIDWNLN